MTSASAVLQLLDPIFVPEVAAKIASLRTSDSMQLRLDNLAEKANEGQLTPEERQEYVAYVEANDIVSIMQAKARLVMKDQKP